MSNLYVYKTILQEVQDALVTLNQSRPTGVYDSQDSNAILMGALANQIGPLLTEAFEWQQFRLTLTVTGDGSTTEFALPAGLDKITSDTGWSQTNRRPVQILNAQQWAAAQAWIGQTPYLTPACRMSNNALEFISAPAVSEVITFEYVTRNWVLDADGVTTKEALVVNADKPLHDSLLFTFALKLKWAEVRGMSTASLQQDFEDRFLQITGRNTMASTLIIGAGDLTGPRLLGLGNIPETGYGL